MCAQALCHMRMVMSGASEASSPPGPGAFEETLKDFWVSRPRRPLGGRKVAGVAAGIGTRYGIDPVLVRVVFATATVFGGVGVCLYVLAWLLFPGEDDEVSPIEALFGRGGSSMFKGFTIALTILLFPLSSWSFAGGWFSGGGVIGLAILVTMLYLLHRGRGQFNRPVVPVGPATGAAFSMSSALAAQRSSDGWDPLAAAPLGWDLPDPTPAPPPRPPARPRRRNTAVGLATFAVALLVAGAGAALSTSGVSWFPPQHIIGLALGVVGVGMVAGAFLNSGRGLIGWAIPLSIAGLMTRCRAPTARAASGTSMPCQAPPPTSSRCTGALWVTSNSTSLSSTRARRSRRRSTTAPARPPCWCRPARTFGSAAGSRPVTSTAWAIGPTAWAGRWSQERTGDRAAPTRPRSPWTSPRTRARWRCVVTENPYQYEEYEETERHPRRRRVNLFTLVLGVATLLVSGYLLTDGVSWLPTLDLRWILAGGAVLVGALMLGASMRRN